MNKQQKENKEALKRWDADSILWTVEMGGLGPGYEQSIQLTAFEILRDELMNKIPSDSEYFDFAEKSIMRTDKMVGGHSGGTAGSAKWLAYHFLKEGYFSFIERARKEKPYRLIQVSKNFPGVRP